MFKLTNRIMRPSCLQRGVTVFSPLLPKRNLPFIFPFHSKVIDDCGVTFSIGKHLDSLSSLKHSFIPFHGTANSYQLTPKTWDKFDKNIAAIANKVESIGVNLLKLACLLGLQYFMEILPKLFSWKEYYSLSEFTAIALMSSGYPDRAIQLIKKLPTVALHAYRSDITNVDPLFWSVKELLALAYLLKGDYEQANKAVDRLIASVQEPAIKSHQARALTIKALIYYIQGNAKESICLQEQAVQLLKGEGNFPLQTVVLYDLWVFHRIINNNKQAEDIIQTLQSLLEKLDHPSTEHIKLFIKQHVDQNAVEQPYKYLP